MLDQLKIVKTTVFFNLSKDSKPTFIFSLLKVSKMTSMRTFISPVM